MRYVACGCDVYKVTNGGQTWQLVKTFKTPKGAEGWVARHS